MKLLIFYCSGFSKKTLEDHRLKLLRLGRAMKNVRSIVIPSQTWKPKCPELVVLDDYKTKPDDGYWVKWCKNTPPDLSDRQSWINGDKLREVAMELDYHRPGNLAWAIKTLSEGARIGARGSGRMIFSADNYPTASSEGHLLADSLNDWLRKDLAIGESMCNNLIAVTIN